jgi:nucleoid-associated protein YgaU
MLGVSLAHGLTNIVLLLVLPVVAAQVTQSVESGQAAAQLSETAQQNAHPTAALEVVVAPPAVLAPVAEAVLVPGVASSASQREERAAILPATTGGGQLAPAAPGLHLVASEPEPASRMQDSAVGEARSDQIGDTIYYRIQSGDTLTAIARRWGTSIEALVQHNAIRDRNLIYSGWLLSIPKSEGNQ